MKLNFIVEGELVSSGIYFYRLQAGDFMNAKTNTAYTSQANLAADFNKTEDIFIQRDILCTIIIRSSIDRTSDGSLDRYIISIFIIITSLGKRRNIMISIGISIAAIDSNVLCYVIIFCSTAESCTCVIVIIYNHQCAIHRMQ